MNGTNGDSVTASRGEGVLRAEDKLGKQVWVMWDGECGFCRRSVELLKSWDEYDIIYPISYQNVPSPPMTPELHQECDRAVHVITETGRLLRAGRAALYVLRFTRYAPLAFWLTLPPMIWFVELGYKIVAANRDLFSDLLFGKEPGAFALPPQATNPTVSTER